MMVMVGLNSNTTFVKVKFKRVYRKSNDIRGDSNTTFVKVKLMLFQE